MSKLIDYIVGNRIEVERSPVHGTCLNVFLKNKQVKVKYIKSKNKDKIDFKILILKLRYNISRVVEK